MGASAGYAVTTHARTCSSVALASKRRCRWLPCGHCTRMGIGAMWRAPELSGVIGAAPRGQWPRAAPPRPPPALGTPPGRAERPRPVPVPRVPTVPTRQMEPFRQVSCQPLQIDEPVDGLQARSREIELLAEFAALLDSPPRLPRSRARAADLRARASAEIVPRSPHPRASACTPQDRDRTPDRDRTRDRRCRGDGPLVRVWKIFCTPRVE